MGLREERSNEIEGLGFGFWVEEEGKQRKGFWVLWGWEIGEREGEEEREN